MKYFRLRDSNRDEQPGPEKRFPVHTIVPITGSVDNPRLISFVSPGNYALRDLARCLPAAGTPIHSVEENTIGALLCAVHQLVNKSIRNGK